MTGSNVIETRKGLSYNKRTMDLAVEPFYDTTITGKKIK